MTFNNSILAGVTLVRDAIESENFDPGVAGWRIERSGDAEFNQVTVRGSITFRPGANSIVWEDNSGVDVFYEELALNFAGSGLPVRIWYANSSTLFMYQADGLWAVIDDLKGGIRVDDTDTLAILKFVKWSGNAVVAEDWNPLTLQAGWSAQAGYYAPAYKFFPDGMMRLRGSITGGTTANGTVIANLPAGYRPAANVRTPLNPTVAGSGLPRAFVSADGNADEGDVQIFGAGAGAAISLEGIEFSLF